MNVHVLEQVQKRWAVARQHTILGVVYMCWLSCVMDKRRRFKIFWCQNLLMRSMIVYNYVMSRLFGYDCIKSRLFNPCFYSYDGLCNVTFIQWTLLVILQFFCWFSWRLYVLILLNIEYAVECCYVVGHIFNQNLSKLTLHAAALYFSLQHMHLAHDLAPISLHQQSLSIWNSLYILN